MTLILTELSNLGIAMAADTAITQHTPTYDAIGTQDRVYHGTMKLHRIVSLGAGVSVWGLGRVGAVDTDIWLRDFITREAAHYDSLLSFAELLRDKLNQILPEPGDQPSLGFHIAGYQQTERGRFPCFYHVHNGPSQTVQHINPRMFNANFDRPPQPYPRGFYYITRNGDFTFYVRLFTSIEEQFNEWRLQGLRLPSPETLKMRAEYLRFQIRTVGQIYKLSNILPWIGGPVTTLTISSDGIESYETREEIVVP